jgi:hypothetical protein
LEKRVGGGKNISVVFFFQIKVEIFLLKESDKL